MHAHPGGHVDASRPDPVMAQRLLVGLGQEQNVGRSNAGVVPLDSSSAFQGALLDRASVSTTSAPLDSWHSISSGGPGVITGSSGGSDGSAPMLRGGAMTTAASAATATASSQQGLAAAPMVAAATGAAPSISAAAALPPGWAQYFDPNTQKPYWHHTTSGITTWDNPNLASSSSSTVGNGGAAAAATSATSISKSSGSMDTNTRVAVMAQQSRPLLEARPSLSVAAGGGAWVTFGSPMDGSELTVSLWVYLDKKAAAEKNMLTLLSNKGTGCAVNE